MSRPRHRTLLATLALVIALLVPAAVPTMGTELDDAIASQRAIAAEIAKQQAALAALQRTAATLKNQLASTRAALAKTNANLVSVRSFIAKVESSISAIRTQIATLDGKIATLDAEIARLEAEEAKTTRDIDARTALLIARIREAYIAGRIPTVVGLLLSADGSLLDAALDASLLTRLGEEDVRLATALKADRARLQQLEADKRESRDAVAELRRAADASRAALADDLAELASLRSQLATLAARQAEQADEMQEDLDESLQNAAALRKIIAELREDEAETAARIRELSGAAVLPTVYTGAFSWPMTGDRVTQNYGCTTYPWYPPRGSCKYWHNGIDLGAPVRTPVRSIAPGKVLIAGRCSYCRVWAGKRPLWWVWVAHSKSLVSVYGHVDDGTYGKLPAVKAGDWVSRGQVLAYVGMTGSTTGPHIHFTVYLDGRDVNPRNYLPTR
jgi:murein DD-endopeptidase MepM/ murein hydrolase activator NlpD